MCGCVWVGVGVGVCGGGLRKRKGMAGCRVTNVAAGTFAQGVNKDISTMFASPLLSASTTVECSMCPCTTRRAKWQGKGKKKKKKKSDEDSDLYALLGLQHERWMATPEQIKAAYRRTAVIYHPDKQAQQVSGWACARMRVKFAFVGCVCVEGGR